MPYSHLAGTGLQKADGTPSPTTESLMRGQFVLAPQDIEQMPQWSRHALPDGFWLVTHPELTVCHATQGNRRLTLIGYVLDPSDPEATSEEILARLLPACGSLRQLLAATVSLGGRWILLANCGDGFFLFTDALGLRQVFHTAPEHCDALWAMSQPGLARDLLGLDFDEAGLAFLDSHAFRGAPEYRWPGAATPLKGLRHLLPNHYLNVLTGEVKRYWPVEPLAPLRLSDAIDRMSALLSGLIRAAAARFDLALSITAGVDSRLVLAAARGVQERLSYVTVRQARMADHHADIIVPARLLAKLNLPHEIIRARASMSPAFSWAFKRSVLFAHDHYGADAEAILAHYGRRKVALTGSGAEVGRCSFRKQLPLSDYRRITAADLAGLQRSRHAYAIKCFAQWLQDAEERANIKLLDLFEWEQGHGNWLAMTQLEFDLAWRDIFTPYNCRALAETTLAVDEQHRRAPDYRLFNLAIKRLWPELLSEPINPHNRRRLLQTYLGPLRRRWSPQFRTAGPNPNLC